MPKVNAKGLIIKELRRTLGMTQQEMGESIGKNQAYISVIESGRKVSFDAIERIVAHFGYKMRITLEKA